MANTENIITQIKRKNVTGFDTPCFIGSSAKYVAGIRGLSGNSLEENILLGGDSITTEEDLADGIKHIVREYRSEDLESEYYVIDLYIYLNNSTERRWFYGDGLFLPEDTDDNVYDSERLIGVNTSVYSFNNNELFSMTNPEDPQIPILSKATLKFISSNQEEIRVAEKIIYAKYTEDGKVIQKQVVRNLL